MCPIASPLQSSWDAHIMGRSQTNFRIFEVTELLPRKTHMPFIHTIGVRDTSKSGAKLNLLEFRAFSYKGFFLVGPVFLSNQRT